MNITQLSEEEFDQQYKPIDHADGGMVWEHADVKDLDRNKVWTIVEPGDGELDALYLLPDFHIVNRIGYVVTEVPWTDDNIEVLWHVFESDEED